MVICYSSSRKLIRSLRHRPCTCLGWGVGSRLTQKTWKYEKSCNTQLSPALREHRDRSQNLPRGRTGRLHGRGDLALCSQRLSFSEEKWDIGMRGATLSKGVEVIKSMVTLGARWEWGEDFIWAWNVSWIWPRPWRLVKDLVLQW